jgi:protein involved in polysaccharide export with SLBB domain
MDARQACVIERRMKVLTILFIAILLSPAFAKGAGPVAVPDPGYRLGPNDIVRVQIFGEDDLTTEGKVGGDGTMNFPLLGPVQVGGRSVKEVRDDVTARLTEGYLRQPKVSISIVRYRNVYVSGEVRTPGGYPYEDGQTDQKALSVAGGLTEKADRRGVKVNRSIDGRVQAISGDAATPVFPDDTIVVAPSEKVYVTGEVARPATYAHEEGMNLQKAITLAGGFTDKAEQGMIKVTRLTDGLAQTMKAELETLLLPDDIIIVELQNHKFYASGEVKTPGSYPYKPGMTVHKAVAMAGGLTEKAERELLRILRHTNGREETVAVRLDAPVFPDDILVVPEAQRFYISGEVKTPGRYVYEKSLTLHKAISMAGGTTEKAEEGTVKVTRLADGQVSTFHGGHDMLVLPDDIIVVEPQMHKFYISGEVKTPGAHPYKDGLTIQKAIAIAGGTTEKADRGSMRVVRMVNGREATVLVTPAAPVLPDDNIVVLEGQRFYVSGEVRSAGRYLYEPGVTVQKAITMAGGFTEKADKAGMTVVRVHGAALDTVPVELDAVIMPDDLVVVAHAQKIYVNGEVKTPGGFPYEKGLTIHKAITLAGGFTDKAAERRTKVLRTIQGEQQSIRVKLDDPVLPEDIIVVPQSFF